MRILVNGALGRMGTQVVQQVISEKDMELAGVADAITGKAGNMSIYTDIELAIKSCHPDVMVDFTRPAVIMSTLRKVLPLGIPCVVGTTGFTKQDLEEVDTLAKKFNVGILIAPNFALGAVVMMKLCCEAAKYFPQIEIIEKHHDKKIDAPSGTALLTAQKIAAIRHTVQQGHPDEKEALPGVRGGNFEGIKIHSLRLPGYVASQEVIFGGQGETLHISTDPINRECFMPGVIMACRKIGNYHGLVYGLEKIL